MHIKTLALQRFRNYESETVGFDPGVNILTGRNGEGKTNLLEAIHILSMGRSFRTQNDAETIQFGQGFCRAKGLFEKGGEDLSVETRMQGSVKSYFVDGIKVQKGADLTGHALTVIFSPDDLRIVKDGPEKRRRFMDHELFQLRPLYYIDVIKYRRIVKNRNLLLKEPVLNWHLLDVYDGYLAETGARIMAERMSFASRLAEISAGIHERITDGNSANAFVDANSGAVCNISGTAHGAAHSPEEDGIAERANAGSGYGLLVSYEPSIDPGADIPADVGVLREVIAAELARRREKDRSAGSTTVGPHKDDLKLELGGIDLRKFGSQGQQRTAALALKLAEIYIIRAETGESPILLLDDVLSELDEGRQKHLLGSFEDCQIIITTAELSADLEAAFPTARRINISSGKADSV